MTELPLEVGEYRLVGHIAQGGMADVFQGEPIAGGEPVVLKRLLTQHRDQKEYIDRFVGEAKLSVKLRHPNIVRTLKLFKKGPDYFIVQELVDGPSLAGLLAVRRALGLPLPLPAVLHLLAGLLSALDYVHRARLGDTAVTIVHRDVSPGNLLVDRQGAVKLTDFGVAEASLHPELKAERGALAGTPAYMSPEQVLGRPLDPRSDIFSAGSILYQCLANRPPFEAEVEYELLRQVKEAAPPPLDLSETGAERLVPVVQKAMAPEASRRFATAAELRRALLAAAEELGLQPDPSILAETVAAAIDDPSA
ncbi:MAG: serine/threonine-protein kinase [Myxococcales bacterium]